MKSRSYLEIGRNVPLSKYSYGDITHKNYSLPDRYTNGDNLPVKDSSRFHDRINIKDYLEKPQLSDRLRYREDKEVPGIYRSPISKASETRSRWFRDRDEDRKKEVFTLDSKRRDYNADRALRSTKLEDSDQKRAESFRNDRFGSPLRRPSSANLHRKRNRYMASPIKPIPSLHSSVNIEPSTDLYKSIDRSESKTYSSESKKPYRISKDRSYKEPSGLFGKLRTYLGGYNLNNYENQDRNVDNLRKMLHLDDKSNGKSDKRVKFDEKLSQAASYGDIDSVDEAIKIRRAERGIDREKEYPEMTNIPSYKAENQPRDTIKALEQENSQLEETIKKLEREKNQMSARGIEMEHEISRLMKLNEQLRVEVSSNRRELESKSIELETQLEKLSKTQNQLEQIRNKHISDEQDATRRIQQQSRELYEQQLALENRTNELEYRESELNDREIQIKEAELKGQIRNKLSYIKEHYENKRFKYSQELLHIQSMTSQNLEEFRKVRKQYDYSIEPIDTADKEELFENVNGKIHAELEYLKNSNCSGAVSVEQIDNVSAETFFKELENDLSNSSKRIHEKVRKISDSLVQLNANGTPKAQPAQLRRLYQKKDRLLCKLKHINETLTKMQSVFEYQEDAKVVEMFGKGLEKGVVGPWYTEIKKEIEDSYI